MILFENLKVGDKIFIIPVTMRVQEFVYAGVFNTFNEWDKKPRHVFLNSHLNNLETTSVGYESKANKINRHFYTEKEATERLKQLIIEERERDYED